MVGSDWTVAAAAKNSADLGSENIFKEASVLSFLVVIALLHLE